VAGPDSDGDAISDAFDNCPVTANPAQADTDGDLHGDVCDNCPDSWNADQFDVDNDGIGMPAIRTLMGTGSPTCIDNCPGDPNPDQADADLDGIGDACDAGVSVR
jgi:hypothetical protein